MTKLQTSNLHASAFFNLTLRMRIGGRHNCKMKWKKLRMESWPPPLCHSCSFIIIWKNETKSDVHQLVGASLRFSQFILFYFLVLESMLTCSYCSCCPWGFICFLIFIFVSLRALKLKCNKSTCTTLKKWISLYSWQHNLPCHVLTFLLRWDMLG